MSERLPVRVRDLIPSRRYWKDRKVLKSGGWLIYIAWLYVVLHFIVSPLLDWTIGAGLPGWAQVTITIGAGYGIFLAGLGAVEGGFRALARRRWRKALSSRGGRALPPGDPIEESRDPMRSE